MNRRCLLPILFLPCLLVSFTTAFAAAQEGQELPANVTGNWQISWMARIGTEKGTVRFQQDGAKLAGVFHGNLGAPAVSGSVQGKKVSFSFEFSGKYPFTLNFSGLVEGDKMSGKFGVGGSDDGYDSRGENARPSNYSWNATRIGDPASLTAKDEKPDKPAR